MRLFIDKSLPLILELFNDTDNEIIYFDKLTSKLSTNVDVVICRAHTRINKEFFNGFTAKLIATSTSGSDHLDKQWLSNNQIPWIDAIGSNAQSVCDYVLHVLYHPKIKLTGKKVGIIGIGHVGSKVDSTLSALGFKTVLYDPPRESRDNTFCSANYEELFSCDVISLHVPLTLTGPHKTMELVNRTFLEQCKANCLIINTSRGEIINDDALLKTQDINICLDVFQNEPVINSKIVDKCILATPHIAGHAIEAKQRAMVMLSKKILKHFRLKKKATRFDHLIVHKANKAYPTLNFEYDPLIETEILKNNSSASAFLTLRKQHTARHELSC